MPQLGQLLIQRGLITAGDLGAALRAQQELGGLLGLTLVRMGALAENDLLPVLSEKLSVPILSADIAPTSAMVLEAASFTGTSVPWLISKDAIMWFATTSSGDREWNCASRNPFDAVLQEMGEQWSVARPRFFLASQQILEDVLDKLASGQEGHGQAEARASDLSKLREMAEEAPVIEFVNAIFAEAIQRRASDVHLEPFEDRLVVRLRVDGILSAWRTAPRSVFDAVASRIKILSGMDIAERRLPQDGRQSIRASGREVDLRVSTLPSTWGESLVVRLLGKTNNLPDLTALGVADDHRMRLLSLIRKSHGILLITGPTGSGKTTTIYRLLSELNDGEKKIITVEDPVELDLPGIIQVNVRADIGLTFATGLRSILRQDPDVILVGEIRDAETARIAVQSALTGHLVISTLHTNSALASIPRLFDLGIEPFLLADVVRGVVGQRLVRRTCDDCAVSPSDQDGLQTGCGSCGGTGFRGRIGIYEVFDANEDLAIAIRDGANEAALASIVRQRGERDMLADGVAKVAQGLTSMDEIKRVLGAGGEV
jgi:general secretion pathway protein E